MRQSLYYEKKEGASAFYITLLFTNYRKEEKTMLIIVLGLIATLTLVSGHCDFGTQGADDFDFTEVCTCILT